MRDIAVGHGFCMFSHNFNEWVNCFFKLCGINLGGILWE